MKVFVLGTGRCGTTTFIEACKHLENYTSGHEMNAHLWGGERFIYPDNHIEADNRLTWFLPQLEKKEHSSRVFYVHLQRERQAVVDSFLRRWESGYRAGIIKAFSNGIIMSVNEYTEEERRAICEFYIDTVTAHIENFLEGKDYMRIDLENVNNEFGEFMRKINAHGNMKAIRSELSIRYNSS